MGGLQMEEDEEEAQHRSVLPSLRGQFEVVYEDLDFHISSIFISAVTFSTNQCTHTLPPS